MVLFIPELNRFVVSNEGDGACKIFDAETYKLIDTVKFPDDADQLRYDSKTKRVYVGYGDGAIGAFDATTNKRIEGDFELGAHPESFQLEESGSRVFVNLASISQIAVIEVRAKSTDGSSRKRVRTSRWRSTKRITVCSLRRAGRRVSWC